MATSPLLPGRVDPDTSSYLSALRERVVVFDGATGTNLQLQDLGPEDFGGPELEGCNEHLVLSRPGAVETLHRSFLDVGVEVIETDTFGGLPVTLAEYGLGDQAREINRVGAALARGLVDEYSADGRPRWVAGSM